MTSILHGETKRDYFIEISGGGGDPGSSNEYTKFGQFYLIISKIVATICHILMLKCIKLIPNLLGELIALP